MEQPDTLRYEPESRFCPIPPAERDLPTAVARPWLKVSQEEPNDLEGVSFDRQGNLWFVEAAASRLHRVDMQTGEDRVVCTDPLRRGMSATKHHRDGRVFIPSVGPDFRHGYVFTVNPDGSDLTVLREGPVFDDLTFDRNGGYYYTHFVGSVSDPCGEVAYVSPQGAVTPVLRHLAGPNGVALSTDGSVLWVTETAAGRLLRANLAADPVTLGPTPCDYTVCYRFTGSVGPDSCEVDADDNLYVALYGQGRVLVFNKRGYPIGQVLLAGREEGHFLASTHPMIRPGTNELYICTNDPEQGAWIFKAGAFAGANPNDFARL